MKVVEIKYLLLSVSCLKTVIMVLIIFYVNHGLFFVNRCQSLKQ